MIVKEVLWQRSERQFKKRETKTLTIAPSSPLPPLPTGHQRNDVGDTQPLTRSHDPILTSTPLIYKCKCRYILHSSILILNEHCLKKIFSAHFIVEFWRKEKASLTHNIFLHFISSIHCCNVNVRTASLCVFFAISSSIRLELYFLLLKAFCLINMFPIPPSTLSVILMIVFVNVYFCICSYMSPPLPLHLITTKTWSDIGLASIISW